MNIEKEIREMEESENISSIPWIAPRLEKIKKQLEVIRE